MTICVINAPLIQSVRFLKRMIWVPVLAFLAFQTIQPAFAGMPKVHGIRLGENGGVTRFVMDVDQKVAFSHMILPNPYRVVVDLPEVEWVVKDLGEVSKGHVSGFRYGHFREGVSRLVLDLKGPGRVAKIFTLPPNGGKNYRLVVDIEKVSSADFEAKRGQKPSETIVKSASLSSPSLQARKKKDKRIITVDAGHGGVDPGTISVIGVKEKNIVLQMAKAIKRELEKRKGYEVQLTRDRDIYIPHRQRYGKARKAGADLFMSVHADAIKNPKVRGATVYTLSERASDQEAEALARKENRSDLIAGLDLAEGYDAEVTSILIDLAQRESMNYSARFASYLVPELKQRVKVRNNSHRFANFLVLKAPDVPSVLMEIGYMSNRQDSKMLASKKGRQKISSAVAHAIVNYFSTVESEGQ